MHYEIPLFLVAAVVASFIVRMIVLNRRRNQDNGKD